MSKLRVAMIAPPWLTIPARGYGGIENVLGVLVPELRKLGVHVELFTIRDSTVSANKKHYLYPDEQMNSIHLPWYDSSPIIVAHLRHALNKIRSDGDFDIIHDHNNFFGPLALADTADDIPPAIHTTHNPRFTAPDIAGYGQDVPDNQIMWKQFAAAKKIHFVGLSECLNRSAPKDIKHLMLPPVHNAIEVEDFPFVERKSNYFITLARFHPEKGQSIAVKACKQLNVRLKMAGNVAGIGSPRKLMLELANPLSTYRGMTDFRYFSDYIFPHMRHKKIDYVGEVQGERKLNFLSRAKALLFPIRWDEPFGMAVIEALACGTPVIAMKRGAMPELIEHGVTGFLANDEKEFREYIKRIDEIDPHACRKSVEERFSGELMAKNYINRYENVIHWHSKQHQKNARRTPSRNQHKTTVGKSRRKPKTRRTV
jgi:glycosyltransferase involved in cell wall biosynthesis